MIEQQFINYPSKITVDQHLKFVGSLKLSPSQIYDAVGGIWKVGGCVRDEIMGLKSKDIDFAVQTKSFSHLIAYVKQLILDTGEDPLKLIYEIRSEFLTIRANVPGLGAADFVLCRKEGSYSDGRRPDVVIPGTIFDDLSRRDFTMNAICVPFEIHKASFSPGEMYDPFDGIDDIKKNIIRCVGKAFDRFEEDALRMLRAIRFSIVKKMELDSEIDILLQQCTYLIKLLKENISYERKKDEMFKAFKANPILSLQMMEKYPLIRDTLFSDNSQLWLEPTLKAR